MKFITEEELRYQYQQEPFSEYRLEEGARLTPGARQFLGDRGINMFEDGSLMMFHRSPQRKETSCTESKKSPEGPRACKEEMLALAFLHVGDEVYPYNMDLAKKILSLGEQFSSRKLAEEDLNQAGGEAPKNYDVNWLRRYENRGTVLFSLFELRNQALEFQYYVDALPGQKDLSQQAGALVYQLNLLIDQVVGEERC